MNSKKKVFFKTFGCRTNQFDTQVMISRLKDFELTTEEIDATLVVVNSCTVTKGADSSVRGYINALLRKNHDAKVILAGCGSHSKGESLFAEGKVFKKENVVTWRCQNCGYLHEGEEAPEKCPACAHPQAHFELLAMNW
jgi:tRNA A37 methylthiotransferase MiaB